MGVACLDGSVVVLILCTLVDWGVGVGLDGGINGVSQPVAQNQGGDSNRAHSLHQKPTCYGHSLTAVLWTS